MGASRKALRLYEAAGILPPARRTGAGYRVYGTETLAVLTFVSQAQRNLKAAEWNVLVDLIQSGQLTRI